ncbi:MAG: putative lipopolysaccharide heptosyltransferase III [Nitrosomonadales bacterium]|nr:putative lipopolysaccharide heptosyltransferase III [Nitrosomonadales bacterium]
MSNRPAIRGCRNTLIVQLGDIGDVVLTTPTIRAMKEAYPDARISILIFKPYGSLLAADPNVHEVVETARIRGTLFRRLREFVAFARYLRQKRYDLVIDLRTGDRGAILSFLTGAPVRVGCQGIVKQFWHQILFTKIIRNYKIAPPPVHPGADQSLRVVRELGITTEDSTPRLFIAPGDRLRASALLAEVGLVPGTKMVTLNPFSRWKYKEWDNTKWGEVIDRLWEERRIPAVLIGSPEEAVACQEIVAGRKGHTINLAGKTTLGELTAVLSMSLLHLGVDSAAPHIAAAVGTPTVTIHGPSDWRAWRIVNERHKVVSPAMDCVPCSMMGCDGSGRSRCLNELAAEPVVRKALELLAAFPLGSTNQRHA